MTDARTHSAGGGDETSLHVLRARDGDQQSLAWVVARFSPLLLAQASYRLSKGLRGFYEPEDLVSDVWAVALPHLATSEPTADGGTSALLRFLGTTLVYRVNNLMRKHFRGDRVLREGDVNDSATNLFARLPIETTGVITRAIDREQKSEVLAALEALDPLDREVVIMRGIEQTANDTVAGILGMKPNTVSHRYQRALEKLRAGLPGSVFADMRDD